MTIWYEVDRARYVARDGPLKAVLNSNEVEEFVLNPGAVLEMKLNWERMAFREFNLLMEMV